MSWSSLPSENFQQILSYLSNIDINNSLLVCRLWFVECDYFLKDKTILHINRIPTPEEAGKSKRRFEHIHIIEANELSRKIISSIKGRDFEYAGRITSAFIRYKDYEDLHSTLNIIGKDIRDLQLKNRAQTSNNLTFETLSLVVKLRIECFNQSIETIAPFFSSLKVLDVRADLKLVSQTLIKEFFFRNPKLEELYCNEIWARFDEEQIFRESKNLRVIKTDNSELSSLAFNSILPIETFDSNCGKFTDEDLGKFRRNFKNLKELSLFEDIRGFTEKGFSEIWLFPELKSLELNNFRLSNSFWKNALFKSHNHALTSLSLISIHLNDDLMEMCTRATPNIKYFKANMWSFTSFRSIQEMGDNWKNLETFEFITPTDMSYDEDRLKYPLAATPVFNNLKDLHLSSDFKPETLLLFQHFKSPNLKKTVLEICFWSELQIYREAVNLFSQNYAQVEVLELRDMSTMDTRTVNNVLKSMTNLNSLTLEGTTNLSVKAVGTILNSSRSLNKIHITDFKEMFLEPDTNLKSILKHNQIKIPNLKEKKTAAINQICKEMDPHIEPKHFKTFSRLYTNGIEILLGKLEKPDCVTELEDYDDGEEEEDVDSDYTLESDTDSEDDLYNQQEVDDNYANNDDGVVYEDSDDDEEASDAKRRREM